MHIKIIDLKSFFRLFSSLKWVAFFLAVVILALNFADKKFYSEEYIEAVHEISEEQIIVIDAGHGGEDPGTVGLNGKYEKNLNLEIALALGNMLSEKGYPVVYTRTEDKLLYSEDENIFGIRKISDLKNRCKIAAEYPNAIFISVHMNSYQNEKYSGLQVYYSLNNTGSRVLAEAVQKTVKKTLQPDNNRTVKAGENIYLLKNIDNVSILIECGFLSNPEECEKLSEKEYQKQLSSSIICAIIEYKENSK